MNDDSSNQLKILEVVTEVKEGLSDREKLILKKRKIK